MPSSRQHRGVAGFTFVELLVTLAVAALLVTIGLPALMNLIQRSKLEGQARNLAVLAARARNEAITQGVETVVLYDGSRFVSFVDLHGAALTDPPDGLLNPVAGQPQRTTDWVIQSQSVTTPVTVSAPGSQLAVTGFSNPDRADGRAIFNPDGSLYAEGSFRLADGKGNHLEVALGPRSTGHGKLRKWNGSAWREQGEGGVSWDWN